MTSRTRASHSITSTSPQATQSWSHHVHPQPNGSSTLADLPDDPSPAPAPAHHLGLMDIDGTVPDHLDNIDIDPALLDVVAQHQHHPHGPGQTDETVDAAATIAALQSIGERGLYEGEGEGDDGAGVGMGVEEDGLIDPLLREGADGSLQPLGESSRSIVVPGQPRARPSELKHLSKEDKAARKREFARLRQARYKERKFGKAEHPPPKKQLKELPKAEKDEWQREQRRVRQAKLRERNKDNEEWKEKRRKWDSHRRDKERQARKTDKNNKSREPDEDERIGLESLVAAETELDFDVSGVKDEGFGPAGHVDMSKVDGVWDSSMI